MIIYKITNTINGKLYIGQTVGSLEARFNEHIRSKRCRALSSAISKYGINNFKAEVLETVENLDQLNEKEQYWIKELATLSPNGYNLCSGGMNGKILSDETKKRMSEYMKTLPAEKRPGLGHKKSEEFCKKQAERMRTRTVTEETRLKISEANRGNKNNLGNKWSDQARIKLSIKMIELCKTIDYRNTQKEITTIDKLGNRFDYKSVTEASRNLNVSRTSITNNLTGRSKSAGGYIFQYKKEEL